MTDYELKQTLTKILSERFLSGSNIRKLESLGFTVDFAGKHCKLYYLDNRKEFVTLSKTLSDHRGAKNVVSLIMQMVRRTNEEKLKLI